MTTAARGDWVDRYLIRADPIPLSDSVLELLLSSCSVDQLRHILAVMVERDRVPIGIAVELANELAEILSSDPLETEFGTIYNRPTVGWFRRRNERIAEARRQAGA